MNHEEATGAQATERYLLGELSDQERDAFEEHYFDCALCADDVRSGTAFVSGLRSSGRTHGNEFLRRQAARKRRNFTVPLAAAASILAVSLAWMQFGVVGPLRTAVAEARGPQVLSSY